MRVQTEEWRRFIPGVRMYRGKKTLFYNGEILYDNDDENNYLVYDEAEQKSWEAVIVLPGVEEIPEGTFAELKIETVIMSDSVRWIKRSAFSYCTSLVFVRLSRNLVVIGEFAFCGCDLLSSIFLPPSCRGIGRRAFYDCTQMIILHVPRHTQIGENVIAKTALMTASPFETDEDGRYANTEQVNQWIKDANQGEEYELHRACSSFNPLMEVIYGIFKRKGPSAFKKRNEIGMTPFYYLQANPFVENKIDQKVLMKRYVLEMMGEVA